MNGLFSYEIIYVLKKWWNAYCITHWLSQMLERVVWVSVTIFNVDSTYSTIVICCVTVFPYAHVQYWALPFSSSSRNLIIPRWFSWSYNPFNPSSLEIFLNNYKSVLDLLAPFSTTVYLIKLGKYTVAKKKAGTTILFIIFTNWYYLCLKTALYRKK